MTAIYCLLGTVVLYLISKRLYRRVPKVYLSPLIVTPAAIIIILLGTNTPYEAYNAGGQWLSDMIGPATVAFAVPLYKHAAVLKKHAAEIVIGVAIGSFAAVISSAWLAKLLSLDIRLIDSLAPRSATTPIAVAIAGMIGGIPSVTAVLVLLTGVLGMLLGPLLIRALRIRSDIARGVLFGASSHNAGTSKAFEFGAVPGTISSLSMILAGFTTLVIAPLLIRLFS